MDNNKRPTTSLLRRKNYVVVVVVAIYFGISIYGLFYTSRYYNLAEKTARNQIILSGGSEKQIAEFNLVNDLRKFTAETISFAVMVIAAIGMITTYAINQKNYDINEREAKLRLEKLELEIAALKKQADKEETNLLEENKHKLLKEKK